MGRRPGCGNTLALVSRKNPLLAGVLDDVCESNIISLRVSSLVVRRTGGRCWPRPVPFAGNYVMRIKKVEIEGYRSIRKRLTIVLESDVTVVLGPNDHG